jgi:phosphoenolpyruvate synthase/pyruvate phosphate dikinase
MALELNAREIDSVCLNLQTLIRTSRMSEKLRSMIDSQIAHHLGGVSSFVIRSSSNAEDLENFSAAGIYESMNHVTTAENIFQSIKEVWASLLSVRSVRLRQEVGISLDDCYMGVIIQEEITEASPTEISPYSTPSDVNRQQMGGVLVTTNPGNRAVDFRNVYINASTHSVMKIVQGAELPHQFLFNTVEGGGQTLSLGTDRKDLSAEQKILLQKLALAGRLLQSHFSPDYTFSSPIDVEWLATAEGLFILQLRPYAG